VLDAWVGVEFTGTCCCWVNTSKMETSIQPSKQPGIKP
jgi:hypothetical protein